MKAHSSDCISKKRKWNLLVKISSWRCQSPSHSPPQPLAQFNSPTLINCLLSTHRVLLASPKFGVLLVWQHKAGGDRHCETSDQNFRLSLRQNCIMYKNNLLLDYLARDIPAHKPRLSCKSPLTYSKNTDDRLDLWHWWGHNPPPPPPIPSPSLPKDLLTYWYGYLKLIRINRTFYFPFILQESPQQPFASSVSHHDDGTITNRSWSANIKEFGWIMHRPMGNNLKPKQALEICASAGKNVNFDNTSKRKIFLMSFENVIPQSTKYHFYLWVVKCILCECCLM